MSTQIQQQLVQGLVEVVSGISATDGNIANTGATLTAALDAMEFRLDTDITTVSGDLITTTTALSGDIVNNTNNIFTTGYSLTHDIEKVAADLVATGDVLEYADAVLSGNLVATGAALEAADAVLSGNLVATGAALSGNLVATGAALSGMLVASGASLSGNLVATGATLEPANVVISGNLVTVSGNLVATGAALEPVIDAITFSAGAADYATYSLASNFRLNDYVLQASFTGIPSGTLTEASSVCYNPSGHTYLVLSPEPTTYPLIKEIEFGGREIGFSGNSLVRTTNYTVPAPYTGVGGITYVSGYQFALCSESGVVGTGTKDAILLFDYIGNTGLGSGIASGHVTGEILSEDFTVYDVPHPYSPGQENAGLQGISYNPKEGVFYGAFKGTDTTGWKVMEIALSDCSRPTIEVDAADVHEYIVGGGFKGIYMQELNSCPDLCWGAGDDVTIRWDGGGSPWTEGVYAEVESIIDDPSFCIITFKWPGVDAPPTTFDITISNNVPATSVELFSSGTVNFPTGLERLSDVYYDPNSNHLFLTDHGKEDYPYSDRSRVFECGLTGSFFDYVDLTGHYANNYNQLEGITFSPDGGRMVVVGEARGITGSDLGYYTTSSFADEGTYKIPARGFYREGSFGTLYLTHEMHGTYVTCAGEDTKVELPSPTFSGEWDGFQCDIFAAGGQHVSPPTVPEDYEVVIQPEGGQTFICAGVLTGAAAGSARWSYTMAPTGHRWAKVWCLSGQWYGANDYCELAAIGLPDDYPNPNPSLYAYAPLGLYKGIGVFGPSAPSPRGTACPDTCWETGDTVLLTWSAGGSPWIDGVLAEVVTRDSTPTSCDFKFKWSNAGAWGSPPLDRSLVISNDSRKGQE